ncbi:collagenase [Nonomuraea africana]|uniref:microbial collagenase n=1 Tax=Nonomuraea africana TaxID=46171 RepID=A0ABR9KJC9_9ACTN|nr:collagenase [Nonomuraea africana]MBE1562129.1 microbial collagenase [Nonomuraea africana]
MQSEPLKAEDRPPFTAITHGQDPAESCDVPGLTRRVESDHIAALRAAELRCVSALSAASFNEPAMLRAASAVRQDAESYQGDNRAGTAQLLAYLRAGHQSRDFGEAVHAVTRDALDAFFANPASHQATRSNGEVLAEAVGLIDAAGLNSRYLDIVERLLATDRPELDAARTRAFFVLFGGHRRSDFLTAVRADSGVLDALKAFADRNAGLLGTDREYLTANAGSELARFVRYDALRGKVRPMLKDLLGRSSPHGRTAGLWVAVAEMAGALDKAGCSAYGVCGTLAALGKDVLQITHTCGPTLRIRAQDMTPEQLQWTCSSLFNEDGYFHNLVQDSGPVADDYNTALEVVVYDSSRDYRRYARAMFGIDTNNGGMYLEGDPSKPGNQARFIAYEAEWLRPDFQIWNLNHEYTHYLDGRFDMYGDFEANISTPTVWWIEGMAEYVSYGYRGVRYDAAVTEAAKHTYTLSTLFDTTYDHDTTRVYRWGYLAVRYMVERHHSDVATVLGYYRVGNWAAARAHLKALNYNADFDAWLTACANGGC